MPDNVRLFWKNFCNKIQSQTFISYMLSPLFIDKEPFKTINPFQYTFKNAFKQKHIVRKRVDHYIVEYREYVQNMVSGLEILWCQKTTICSIILPVNLCSADLSYRIKKYWTTVLDCRILWVFAKIQSLCEHEIVLHLTRKLQ